MRYVPYHRLGREPNVVVDGAPNAATRLTLSHWPKSRTPADLKDDLSAQIAFRYLDRPERHVAVDAVSNNHFDEDGLVSVLVLTEPAAALALRDRLVGIAAAGDFGTYQDRAAARAAFTVAAFADEARSPLGRALFARPYPELCAALYEALLPRLVEIARDPSPFRALWQEEDEALTASEEDVRSGRVSLTEDAALDLAVVRIPEDVAARAAHRFTQPRPQAVHPMALHNATSASCLVLLQGRSYEVQYRYEGWVQLVSRRPRARRDLSALAASLSGRERQGRWTFDGADKITPRLRLEGARESVLSPEEFVGRLREFLRAAPPAWDPYD